jgi:hypothetical protein
MQRKSRRIPRKLSLPIQATPVKKCNTTNWDHRCNHSSTEEASQIEKNEHQLRLKSLG